MSISEYGILQTIQSYRLGEHIARKQGFYVIAERFACAVEAVESLLDCEQLKDTALAVFLREQIERERQAAKDGAP